MGWDVRIMYSTALAGGGGRCHITCQVSLSAHHQGIFPGSIRPGIWGEGRRNDLIHGTVVMREGLGLTGPLFCLLSLMSDEIELNWTQTRDRIDLSIYCLVGRYI